jgi:glucokinase
MQTPSRPSAPFVLGIDYGGTKIALATARPDGTLLHRAELPTLADAGAEQALARSIAAGRTLIATTRIEGGGELSAIGVASMGVTLEDRVLMAPNVPGWDRLAIPPTLRAALGVERVVVDNDVRAAAAAELRWGALAGVESAIYLNLGTGIMAVPIVAGQVVRGAHGAAGEIAYNLRHPGDIGGVREGRAPLEEFVGGGAVAARARRDFGEACTPGELFARIGADARARAFVEAILSEVAFHLGNLANALDPALVVVGGGFMRSRDIVLPFLAAHLERVVSFPPQVAEARFLLDASLQGSIALAIHAAGE